MQVRVLATAREVRADVQRHCATQSLQREAQAAAKEPVLLHRFLSLQQHLAQIGLHAKLFLSQGCPLQELDRRRFLLRYVQAIQPEVMEDFVQHAPAHVRLHYTCFAYMHHLCTKY